MALSAPQITPVHVRRFHDEGFFVIESALGPDELETLRSECRRLVAERDAEMTRLGVDTLDLCHRGRRYFIRVDGEPMFGADGAFAGYRGTSREVTEQRADRRPQLERPALDQAHDRDGREAVRPGPRR